MQVGYGQGAWITMAVKESIPEPATIILLCLGGMMLRRKKA
jgi:predicted esterase